MVTVDDCTWEEAIDLGVLIDVSDMAEVLDLGVSEVAVSRALFNHRHIGRRWEDVGDLLVLLCPNLWELGRRNEPCEHPIWATLDRGSQPAKVRTRVVIVPHDGRVRCVILDDSECFDMRFPHLGGSFYVM